MGIGVDDLPASDACAGVAGALGVCLGTGIASSTSAIASVASDFFLPMGIRFDDSHGQDGLFYCQPRGGRCRERMVDGVPGIGDLHRAICLGTRDWGALRQRHFRGTGVGAEKHDSCHLDGSDLSESPFFHCAGFLRAVAKLAEQLPALEKRAAATPLVHDADDRQVGFA